jgi:hypothetical protein
MQVRSIDLDAARAARSEALGDKPVVRFAGRDWTLPAELPWAVAEASSGQMGDLVTALKALLGNQWADFQAETPTVSDMTALVEAIPALYGLDDAGK